MFHSTLRRQLRIVNSLIGLKTFKKLIGFETSTMITADVYPLIKSGRIVYDDIINISKITNSDLSSPLMSSIKNSVMTEMLSEIKESEKITKSNKRCSSKVSNVGQNAELTQRDKNLISFMLLVKLGQELKHTEPKINRRSAKSVQKSNQEFSFDCIETIGEMKTGSSDHSPLKQLSTDVHYGFNCDNLEPQHDVTNLRVDFSEPLDSSEEVSLNELDLHDVPMMSNDSANYNQKIPD